MSRHNIFRDGRVHVLSEKCPTCVFHPGNRMRLEPGRLAGMVKDATEADSTIVCHSTLDDDNAACRGFFDLHKSAPLQIAERLDLITYVDAP